MKKTLDATSCATLGELNKLIDDTTGDSAHQYRAMPVKLLVNAQLAKVIKKAAQFNFSRQMKLFDDGLVYRNVPCEVA